MGSGHSSNRTCFPTAKSGRPQPRTHGTSSKSLENLNLLHNQEGEKDDVVVLREHHFRGTNLKTLIEQQRKIHRVRFGVGDKMEDGQEWIPTDNELIQLAECRSLRSLDLTGCKEITRRGLTNFSLTPGKIKTLILNDCPRITNNFFSYIVHFHNLEKLSLRGCFRISDRGIDALTSLKHLLHLDISVHATETASDSPKSECPTVTNTALKTLARMTLLETLEIEQCREITDEGILLLATLRNLTCLNLSDTGLTNRGLQILRHFLELKNLKIGGTDVSESEILHQLSSSAPPLTCLNVSRLGVSDTLIHGLSKDFYHTLTSLDISGSEKLTDRCGHHLNKLTSLTYLNVNACPGLTPKLLKHLGGLTDLRALHISGITVLESDDLLNFHDLHQLEMGARSAEDDHLSRLSALKHLTDLTLHLPDSTGEPPSIRIKVLGIKVQLLRHPV